jgi:hypothetical protein
VMEGVSNLLYGPQEIAGWGRFLIGFTAGALLGYVSFHLKRPTLAVALSNILGSALNEFFNDKPITAKAFIDIIASTLTAMLLAHLGSKLEAAEVVDGFTEFLVAIDVSWGVKALSGLGEFSGIQHFTDLIAILRNK